MHSLGDIFTTAMDGQPRLTRALTLSEAAAYMARTTPDPDKAEKRPAPFSIRLTGADRARLIAEAAGLPLGTYMRKKLLGEAPPPRVKRTGIPVQDQQALAQLVALLGRSRLFENVAELASLARNGALPSSPDTLQELRSALLHVRDMRLLLLAALGLKPDSVLRPITQLEELR